MVERKGGKLENKYSGPYIIKTSDGKGVYTLKDLDGKVLKKKCNIKRLKVNMNVYIANPITIYIYTIIVINNTCIYNTGLYGSFFIG